MDIDEVINKLNVIYRRQQDSKVNGVINPSGIEGEHEKADEILCDFLDSLGYEEITSLYNKIEKWYA